MKTVIVQYYTTNDVVIKTEIEAEEIKFTNEVLYLTKSNEIVAAFPLDSIIGAYFKAK